MFYLYQRRMTASLISVGFCQEFVVFIYFYCQSVFYLEVTTIKWGNKAITSKNILIPEVKKILGR